MALTDLDYFLLARNMDSKPTAAPSPPEISLDALMDQSYQLANIPPAPQRIEPSPYRQAPQRIDPETMGQGRREPPPQINEIPWQQRMKEHMASSGELWGTFLGGLGRSGRANRGRIADPAGAEARVRNQYLAQQQAMDALRASRRPPDEMTRLARMAKLRKQLADAGIAEKKLVGRPELEEANLQKAKAEAKLKSREVSEFGKESERKQALVETMLASGKVDKSIGMDALMSMSMKTLESMAKDIGLSELDLKKARAQGGISGGVGGTGISRSKSPEVATALQKAMIADSVFIDDPNERSAYSTLGAKDELSKAEARVFEGIQKKAGDTKERLVKKADKWISDFNDPEKNIGQMFEAINELKSTLSKYPHVPGWGEITSSIENLGDLGQWFIDLKNVNDPSARDIMNAIRRYKEAYARAASGAAIGQLEWTNFARQLGVGAFSNPDALKSGLNRAERVLKGAVTRSYNANVDPRLRGYGEWSEPVKPYLIPSKQQAQAVADKYRRAR